MTGDELEVFARRAFATLEGVPPEQLRTFAIGLRLGGGPAARFGAPLLTLADHREAGEIGESRLALLQLRFAMRRAALREPGLIATLADVETPFWAVVEEALVAVAKAGSAGSSAASS